MHNNLITLPILIIFAHMCFGCHENSRTFAIDNNNSERYVVVNEDNFIVEYIQHAKKEDFSDPKLNDLITEWVANVNMMSNQPMFAEILSPSTSRQVY